MELWVICVRVLYSGGDCSVIGVKEKYVRMLGCEIVVFCTNYVKGLYWDYLALGCSRFQAHYCLYYYSAICHEEQLLLLQ